MPYVKPVKPVGVNPALVEDRMPVFKVFNGDTWTLDADAWDPSTGLPAKPDTVKLEFVLTENRFIKEPFWTGTWYNGILPDENVEGLVHISIPKEVSSELRRGVYAFSMTATDYLNNITDTQLKGHFDVEYEPTSPTHNIPYRKGS